MYRKSVVICPEGVEEITLISDTITISGKCKCGHFAFAFIPQIVKGKLKK